MSDISTSDYKRVKRVIVIGASAGGVESLIKLVKDIPGTLESPICVTIHTSPIGGGRLPDILTRSGNLLAKLGEDGETLCRGTIYIAPPDLHMMIEDDKIKLSRGPRENRHRPAINPLFRSAVKNFDGNVIGIILSGTLDDGTAGMKEIKAAGGTTIVQDPGEAIFSGMPENAIQNVSIDHVLKLADIVPCLVSLCKVKSEEPQLDLVDIDEQLNSVSVIPETCHQHYCFKRIVAFKPRTFTVAPDMMATRAPEKRIETGS